MPSPVVQRTVIKYVTEDQKCPYDEGLRKLKDGFGKSMIFKAVTQMEKGNFGDHKSLGGGLFERRVHYGPGYRVYYLLDGEKTIVLLAVSDKSDQGKAIEQSRGYLSDYKARKKAEK